MQAVSDFFAVSNLLLVAGVLVLLVLLKSALVYVPNNRVGIKERLWSPRGSIKGGIIALNGEAGFEPEMLRGGFHLLVPFMYRVHKKNLVFVPQSEIGYVFARDGVPLPPGQSLGSSVEGQSFEDVRVRLQGELREVRQDMIRLLSAAVDAGNKAFSEGSEYVLTGEHNLLAVRDLSQDVTRLKQLFDLFERKTSLLQILDLSLRGQGVQIFIGGESGVNAPDDVSVVTSPYTVNGEVVGTVGVIGPTRMAYDRVIPIVDITAKLLSSALSQH